LDIQTQKAGNSGARVQNAHSRFQAGGRHAYAEILRNMIYYLFELFFSQEL